MLQMLLLALLRQRRKMLSEKGFGVSLSLSGLLLSLAKKL
jgi:hypothetical protein